MTLDPKKPLFSVGQVAKATGVPVNTIKTWMGKPQNNRPPVYLSQPGDDLGADPGAHRRLTARTAVGFGVARRLMGFGLTAHIAVRAGMTFAHTEEAHADPRGLGELFEGSESTVVAVSPAGAIRIVRADRFTEIMNATFYGQHDDWRGGTWAELDGVYIDVMRTLSAFYVR